MVDDDATGDLFNDHVEDPAIPVIRSPIVSPEAMADFERSSQISIIGKRTPEVNAQKQNFFFGICENIPNASFLENLSSGLNCQEIEGSQFQKKLGSREVDQMNQPPYFSYS